jgi:NosR/NirI family transcriptional regulator, nitrous oxide reductase regulator
MPPPWLRRAAVVVMALALVVLCAGVVQAAEQKFALPKFSNGYERPAVGIPEGVPGPRPAILDYTDVAVLLAAIAAAAFMALVVRSRRWIWVISLASLVYFGFWRAGCICSVGSIQDVALALADKTYIIPLSVLAFFAVPLAATILTGRTFCSSVCPLGAIQDLVAVRPVEVPKAVDHSLGLLAYVYLGAGVLFAATGSLFLICQYDPFVSFFRLVPLLHPSETMYASAGSAGMLLVGGVFLAAGIFIGRPYCRWLCPYGAIMRLLAPLAIFKTTITPDKCVGCRLCENACPYGAIEPPTPDTGRSPAVLAALAAVTLALVAGLGFAGSQLAGPFSRMNYTVQQAQEVRAEEIAQEAGQDVTPADIAKAFEGTGRKKADLYKDAAAVRDRFVIGGWFFGGLVGLVFGAKLLRLAWGNREHKDFRINHAKCVSCGRCFATCPRSRLKTSPAAKAKGEAA